MNTRFLLSVLCLASTLALGCRTASNVNPVRAVLDRYVGTGRIAGVVSIISDADYNVQIDCAGWADVENSKPIRPDTMFAIFSMTKTFTGLAMMVAIDEGKISLDDEVAKFLPEFRDVRMENGLLPKRPLTVRDLMSHVTGWRGGVSVVNRDIPLREVARKLAATPLKFQPGETFAYGNSWICTGAACLEVATGVPFERYLQEKILDPLGMRDTTFWPSAEQQSRMVKAYTSNAYLLRPGKDRCTDQLVFPKPCKIHPAASGGLYSTPQDMICLAQLLAHHGEWKGKTIVSRTTFDRQMAVKQTPAEIREPYTVGAWLWGDWLGHEGAMRTDERANLKTGHSRVFFIQTENAAGPAFFQLKAEWHSACDRLQGTPATVFGT